MLCKLALILARHRPEGYHGWHGMAAAVGDFDHRIFSAAARPGATASASILSLKRSPSRKSNQWPVDAFRVAYRRAGKGRGPGG